MKAYLLFAGDHYYPSGGMKDYQGSFDTVEQALAYLKDGYYLEWDDEKEHQRWWDWYQVVESSGMFTCDEGNV